MKKGDSVVKERGEKGNKGRDREDHMEKKKEEEGRTRLKE